MPERSAPHTDRPPVWGIVLAAGASKRTGFPKALATLGGTSFVRRACHALLDGGCQEVIPVVAPPHGRSIEEHLGPDFRVLENPQPELGMSSSLMTALADDALEEAGAVVVALVDHPRVLAITVRQLIERWLRDRPLVVRPCHRGRTGHPYLMDRGLFSEVLRQAPGSDLRPLLRKTSVLVSTPDPGILDDLDDLARISALGGKKPMC